MSDDKKYLPLVRMVGMYENQSQKTGNTYFVGYLGAAKVLLLKDDRAVEGHPTLGLFLQEREPKTEQPQGQQGYQRGGQQRAQPTGHPQGPATAYPGDLPF